MNSPSARAHGTSSESTLFGTDGVRGRPGEGILERRSVERLLLATLHVLQEARSDERDFPRSAGGTILIGRDTRGSGPELVAAISEVLVSRGYTVLDVGVLPTPGVAYVGATWPEIDLSVMVSASHNPADYNGIKYFAPTGAKVSADFEVAVESAFDRGHAPEPSPVRGCVASRVDEAFESYVAYLASASSSKGRAPGREIVLDTAQGAAFQVAPEVFRRLGFRVVCLGDRPDGRNINDRCGALEPAALAARLREGMGKLGFAFDGDGDRMIPVTAGGVVLDGDHVLYLCGSRLLRDGRLPRSTIVATVMSNLGLEVALRKLGVGLLRFSLGDRNVYRTMIEEGYSLGGEQSGHVIFLDHARTGDGSLAAIRCLDSLGDSLDLDAQAAQAVPRFPQLLRNVAVRERRHLDDIPGLREAIREAESSLGAEGRIVVRYSGTEPLLRVMVEGADGALVESLTESICQAVPDELRFGD